MFKILTFILIVVCVSSLQQKHLLNDTEEHEFFYQSDFCSTFIERRMSSICHSNGRCWAWCHD
jgi:hypothetical protein